VNLNIAYDANTLGTAPSGFFSAVNYVVSLFDATFTNNVTVNIEVGYGSFPFDGSTVPPLGENIQNNLVFTSYTQVRQALLNEGAPGATTLPLNSPISGGLVLGSAEEKALGLIGPSSALDGWIGIASDTTLAQQLGASWSYSPTAAPGANQYYLVGVLEHEITEVMGRASYLDIPGEHAVMDLYRYKAPGVRQTGTGGPAYFSTNGGATNLDNWNTRAGGDIGDWASSAGADAFLAFNPPDQINELSGTDLTLMSAIGWTISAAPIAGSGPAHFATIQYSATHQVDFLAFSGTNLSASFLLSTPLWNVVGSGDFNHDGRLDLVTQGPAGQLDLVYLSYGTVSLTSRPYLGSFSIAASGMANGNYWPVHGTGNFGTVPGITGPALVSQDPSSGMIDLLWLQANGGLAASELLLGNYWEVCGAGDFNGDGHTEIITQSTGGQIDLLSFTGVQLTGSELLDGSYWPVVAVDDINHDGKADITTQDPVTGQVDHLFFTGTMLTGSQLDTPPFPGSSVVNASLLFNQS
jgi:hypothetical protein